LGFSTKTNSGPQPFLALPQGPSSKKYPMGHFAMLTSYKQLAVTVLHIGQWTQGHVQSRFYGTLCGPL